MNAFSQEKSATYKPCIFFLLPIGRIKHFRRGEEIEVKRGKEILKTTPEREATRQLDTYLQNAKTRIKRRSTGQTEEMAQ